MEIARRDTHAKFPPGFQAWQKGFPLLAAEILRWGLPEIISVLNPSAPHATATFSSAAALATYYAWVIAFDVVLQSGSVFVPEVGSFLLVAARAGNRVDFSADEALWKLIKINAEKPPLPDQISPPEAFAA